MIRTPEGENFGWVEDRKEVERICTSLRHPVYALAADDAVMDASPRDVFFPDAEKIVFGQYLPAFDQKIGDCVGQGFTRGAQDISYLDAAAEVMAEKRADYEAPLYSTEVTYALSRIEVGGGRLGNGDGSVGAWAAKAVSRWGVVKRQRYGDVDLTHYDWRIAREWGKPNHGVPEAIERKAREHPVLDVSLVTNADVGRLALQNFHPIPVCSTQGFTRTRERETGLCYPAGRWNHCMLTRGFLILRGNRWVVVLQQSWGQDPVGPNEVVLESGKRILLPEGGFCADMEVWDRMLAKHDSFALIGATGYKRVRPSHDIL